MGVGYNISWNNRDGNAKLYKMIGMLNEIKNEH